MNAIRTLIALGFILYLYDGATHKPVNREPFHVFISSQECQNDVTVWKDLAPEWLAACREERK